jgi:hypothetical protein
MAVSARNLVCLLPDRYVPVETWAPHPCGGWYVAEAWVYGPQGRLGYWLNRPGHTVSLRNQERVR